MPQMSPLGSRSQVDAYKNPEDMGNDKAIYFSAGTQTNIPSIAIDFRPESNSSPTLLY